MILNNPTVTKILNKQSKTKMVSDALKNDYKRFGFTKNYLTKKFENIEELKKYAPGSVLCEVIRPSIFQFSRFKFDFNPGEIYVMPLDFYTRTFHSGQYFCLKPYKKKFCEYFKRYSGENINGKKLLIWRVGGLGDLMFSQPLVQYLKEKYPNSHITYATSPENMSLFNYWADGLVDRIISIPFRYEELDEHDFHLSFEGSIERCKEAEKINCYDIFKKVANLEFDIKKYHPKLFPKIDDVKKFSELVPKNTILLQVRASSPTRMMKTTNWVLLIKKLLEMGFKVGFIDSSDNYKMYDAFNKLYDFKETDVINFAKYSNNINDGISILSNCKALIGIDSSFTHFAPALGIPTVGVYGPFLGDLRMRYYNNSQWVDSIDFKECGLYPCFFHQSEVNKCPYFVKKEPVGCLSSISEDEIIKKLKMVLNYE